MKTRLSESAGGPRAPGPTPFVAVALILNVLGYVEIFTHVNKIACASVGGHALDVAELQAHLKPALERLGEFPQLCESCSTAGRLAYLVARPWLTLRIFFDTPFAELPRTAAFAFGVIFTLAWPFVPARRKRAFCACFLWALAAGEVVLPLGRW